MEASFPMVFGAIAITSDYHHGAITIVPYDLPIYNNRMVAKLQEAEYPLPPKF
jgi:hypothetical protein